MPFSAIDYTILSTHGFFNVYAKYRDRLLVHAKSVFQRLKANSNITPFVTDCELELEFELPLSTLFSDIVADLSAGIPFPTPQDAYWEFFVAGPVARYVTDKEWLDIVI